MNSSGLYLFVNHLVIGTVPTTVPCIGDRLMYVSSANTYLLIFAVPFFRASAPACDCHRVATFL